MGIFPLWYTNPLEWAKWFEPRGVESEKLELQKSIAFRLHVGNPIYPPPLPLPPLMLKHTSSMPLLRYVGYLFLSVYEASSCSMLGGCAAFAVGGGGGAGSKSQTGWFGGWVDVSSCEGASGGEFLGFRVQGSGFRV